MFIKNTASDRHSVVVYTTTYITILVKVVGFSTAASSTPYECDAGDYKFCLMDKNPAPTIRELYPHFTDEQLAEAEDNLERYLTLALSIFERRELEKAEQLTEYSDAIPCEVSASEAS
jgi:hypothetical protein